MTEKSRYLGMGLSWNPVSDKSCWTSGSVSRNRYHRCHQRLGDIHLLQGGAGYLRNRDTSSAFFSGKYRQGGRGKHHDHEREQVKTKLLHLTKATTPTTTHNTHALAHHNHLQFSYHDDRIPHSRIKICHSLLFCAHFHHLVWLCCSSRFTSYSLHLSQLCFVRNLIYVAIG